MENPLSEEDVIKMLSAVYKKKYKKDFPDIMIAAIERVIDLAKNSANATIMLEEFCKNEKKDIRLTEHEVHASILPPGYNATLYDAKVNSRGPDDKIYKDKPMMRRFLARGTTMMRLKGPESWFDTIVYANKKFIGGIGDEDESQPENDEIWRQYCLQPPENAREVVCMTKLNGEAAHFSGRYIAGKFYIFTGSKNTHMLIQNEKDIDHYSDARFSVARTVAKGVCETLNEMDNSMRHLLYSFLHHTKCTAVCEILQPEYQHIVDLSYLKKPQINFIAFTPTANANVELTLTALPPHHNLDLIKALELHCTDYTTIYAHNILEHRDQIRSQHNKEGEVFYYINEKGETVGIAKAKTVWYILLRALREKAVFAFTTAKKNKDWNLRDRTMSVYKRFNEIQNWLKISEECVQNWKILAESFMQWLDKECNANKIEGKSIRPEFPVVWKKFLESTGKDDKISL